MKRIISYNICLLLFLSGCIEELDLKTDTAGNENLVVEARLSNINELTKVKLKRSISLEEGGQPPMVANASVELIDSADNCFELLETGIGIYTNVNDEFVPDVGNFYRLHITLSSGKEYFSEAQEFLKPIVINTVEREIVRGKEVINGTLRNVSFIQINETEFHYNGIEDSLYFYHDYEGVYAFRSPFQGSAACFVDSTRIAAQEISLTCYQTSETDIPTNVSSVIQKAVAGSYNIMQIRPGFEFLIGYSMIVRRQHNNKGFYDYITKLKQQSDYGGSIFDAPPFKVEGNIYNVENSNDRALGYFYTESITYAERIFIDNKDIPGPIYENRNATECFNNFDQPNIGELQEEEVIRPQLSCCDCRVKMGSTDRKPSFWPQLEE